MEGQLTNNNADKYMKKLMVNELMKITKRTKINVCKIDFIKVEIN